MIQTCLLTFQSPHKMNVYKSNAVLLGSLLTSSIFCRVISARHTDTDGLKNKIIRPSHLKNSGNFCSMDTINQIRGPIFTEGSKCIAAHRNTFWGHCPCLYNAPGASFELSVAGGQGPSSLPPSLPPPLPFSLPLSSLSLSPPYPPYTRSFSLPPLRSRPLVLDRGSGGAL